MVAGTAAAVGVALTNGRRLTPVFVEASPAPRPQLATMGGSAATMGFPNPRAFFARRFAHATLLAFAGLALVAAIAASGAFAFQRTSSSGASSAAPAFGPQSELRAAASVSGGYEQAYSSAVPSADQVGGTLLAAVEEQNVINALKQIDADRQAQAAAEAYQQSLGASAVPGARPRSLNGASGYAAGTVLSSRITIYGCVGAGGGFCHGMASGIQVFEGAAACSSDLPFGTKLRIIGDPTGRIYECLDRGSLAATWVDVFFYNTADGIAWQSLLGGTVVDIEIVN